MNWINALFMRILRRQKMRAAFAHLMRLRSQKMPTFLQLKPDPSAKTYYQTRSTTRLSKAGFQLASLRSPQDVQNCLSTHWQSQSPELVEFASACGEMTALLKESQIDAEDVSPFIYVMY